MKTSIVIRKINFILLMYSFKILRICFKIYIYKYESVYAEKHMGII